MAEALKAFDNIFKNGDVRKIIGSTLYLKTYQYFSKMYLFSITIISSFFWSFPNST